MTPTDLAPADPPRPTNSSFLPGTQIQFAWDSTSLGLLKECPRKYFLSIIEHWRPRAPSVHLEFGQLYHKALEIYDHLRFDGMSHREAEHASIKWLLVASWPWPYEDRNKSRMSLVRTVVWYLEHFKDDPAQTIRLENGKPAVELSFRFPLDIWASDDQPYLLSGHLDRLAEFNSRKWVLDRKTSKQAFSYNYSDKYSPDNQMSLYRLAGEMAFGVPIAGIIIDGAEIGVNFSRFQRFEIHRTKESLAEWLVETKFYIQLARQFAESNFWPMNDKSCGNYGGCQFRGICSKPPSIRGQWLAADFKREMWDPLSVRGDI